MGVGQWVVFGMGVGGGGVSQGLALLWFGRKAEGQMLDISGS